MATRTHRTNYDIAASDHASPAFRSVQRAMQQTEKAGQQLRNFLGTIGAGFSAGAFATAIVTESRAAEQSSNRLVAVLRATGHAAGVTKGELDAMAESVQDALGFDDESVRNAQSTLLKFGNIQGDVFREGIRLSADLAAFMGTNIPEAAQIIGKSLQSPTEGLTQMERQFGKLTAEQEKNIKSLVEQGRAIDAQNAVLDLWRSKIGGTAEAMNTGLTRATRDVANAWSDMLEELGRSGPVSRFVIDGLTGIRDILRDIKGLVAPQPESPLRRFNVELESINEELERLNKQAAVPTTAAQRAGLGREANEQARKQIDERIAFLRARGREIVAEQQALAQAFADWENFEAGMANAGMARPQLGGKTTDEGEAKRLAAEAQREAEFRAQKAVELEEMAATDSREAWEFYTKGRLEQEEQIRKSRDEGMKAWFETIDMEQDRAIEAGEAYLDAEAARKEALRDTQDVARQLGFTFQSAFEDAILQGRKFSEVLKAIGQDIARIIIRKSLTEPLGTAIAGGVSSFFSDGGIQNGGFAFADGGRPPVGVPSLVGERGPELFVPDQAGTVVPNGSFGGNTYYIDARGADVAAVARLERSLLALAGPGVVERRAIAANREIQRR